MNTDDSSKRKERRWPTRLHWIAIVLALAGVLAWPRIISRLKVLSLRPQPQQQPH